MSTPPGTVPKAELLEYLNGPPLEVHVHDRDRRPEEIKQKPTLFGEDMEDDKISNVSMITSKLDIFESEKNKRLKGRWSQISFFDFTFKLKMIINKYLLLNFTL